MAEQTTAESLLKALTTALNSAHISSWQTTSGWQKELDAASDWLELNDVKALHAKIDDLQSRLVAQCEVVDQMTLNQKTLEAMYNEQCQATDEWHEAFLAERAAKSPERIAELEKQLADMNERYADLQEAMDRMAPYE